MISSAPPPLLFFGTQCTSGIKDIVVRQDVMNSHRLDLHEDEQLNWVAGKSELGGRRLGSEQAFVIFLATFM